MLQLSEGTVFRVECDDGVTGLILIGRGLMTFSPTAAAERGQLRLFSGNDTLTLALRICVRSAQSIRLQPAGRGRPA